MSIEPKVENTVAGTLNITYEHPEYGTHTLALVNEGLPSDTDYFYLNPKYRKFGAHEYYMAVKFKRGLEINKEYILEESDNDLVRAHLEIDWNNGDKNASGTFRLSRGGDHPKGVFQLFEENVFSVEGDFEFQEKP